MDKYFFNNFLIQICNEDFEGRGYRISKALGHFNGKGKVVSQKVNHWLLKKAEIRASTFVEIINKLGYEIQAEVNKI